MCGGEIVVCGGPAVTLLLRAKMVFGIPHHAFDRNGAGLFDIVRAFFGICWPQQLHQVTA